MKREHEEGLEFLLGKHYLSGVNLRTERAIDIYDKEIDAISIDFILDHNVVSIRADYINENISRMRSFEISSLYSKVTERFPLIEVVGTFMENYNYANNKVINLIDCITGKIILKVGTMAPHNDRPYFIAEWKPQNTINNLE